ncbi:MAG: glycine C-acetyltransferase [Candidatus Delongbacteria bacterium]|nr:glycine C-acetyltransferase [Candidatus Delongbacteria bacterium]MBN2836130.1 glycine C-acetyltransferase [Candidatus Delongbacteria bacterium]
MYGDFKEYLENTLEDIKAQGLYKKERTITTPQGVAINTVEGGKVLNFCANNYLGLSNNDRVKEAAKKAIDEWGFGLSSVRFICGTQGIHKELEDRISKFLETEDTILFSSAFDANGGVFEPLLDENCAIISDALNHASIIDGVRLCKAKRYRYENNDMEDLEAKLIEAKDAKFKLVVTDGVFSMDGIIAQVDKICDLADKYNAMVMVDDSHATGFVGKRGKGSAEHSGALGRVDIISTTFGKALGGASGGCISGKREIIDLLRQRARPYLFSNSIAPAIAGATIEVINMLEESTELRDKVEANTKRFREGMNKAGFRINPGTHSIVPIMLGHLENDARLSQVFADELLKEGVYVIGFYYPVVPKGKARIRVQISAAHSFEDIDFAIDKFTSVAKKLNII